MKGRMEKNLFNNKEEKCKKYEADKIVFSIYERNVEPLDSRYAYNESEKCYYNLKNDNKDQAVIMCAGDLMCEPKMAKAMMCNGKYFFEHGFEKARNVFKKSDLAIANLETTVTPSVPYAHEQHHIEGRYHCNAPIEYLDGIRYAGFDVLVQANNHNADAGAEGIFETIDNVEKKGFLHTGLFSSENDRRFLLINVNNIKLAILSYTEHVNRDLDKRILNDLGQEVLINRYSKDKLQKDIVDAKKAGAEFIIVYNHFRCKEYSHVITDHQRDLAKEMAELGADCIMGSHSHSLQRYETITTSDGRVVPVVFSLGNFMTSDNTSMITRKSIIYVLHLVKENDVVKICKEEYVPCRLIEGIGSMSYDVWPTPADWTDNRKRNILIDAEKEIVEVMGSTIPVCKNIEPYQKNNNSDSSDTVIENPIPKSKMKTNSKGDMHPQISIREVCEILDLPLPDISTIDIDKKRTVSASTWAMKENGIAFVRKKYGLDAEYAKKMHASMILDEVVHENRGGYSIKYPKGMEPRHAYAKVCKYIKSQYDIPTIAVTGNAGKTTTKDLIGSVFCQKKDTLCISKNYNTWPVTGEVIQNLTENHEVYIQEVHEPHSRTCSEMLTPDVVVFTNLERAHLNETGGTSLEASIKSTLRIMDFMKEDGVIFANNNCPYLANEKFEGRKVVRYGAEPCNNDYWAENIVNHGENTSFTICSKKDKDINVVLHVSGIHNVGNAVGAYAVARYYGIDPKDIVAGLESYYPDGVRQNLVKVNDRYALVDCYSSTILSAVAAAKTLCELPIKQGAKRVAVFSYLPTLDVGSESVHRELGRNIAKLPVDKIIAYRNDAKFIADECTKAGKDAIFFQYHKDIINYLKENLGEEDNIVFKGVTFAHLEQIANNVLGLNIIPENSLQMDRESNGGDF